eukprot:jgi/Botrbrau1/3885/Bobra.0183s0106.1
MPMLKTARLACQAFRSASIPCITKPSSAPGTQGSSSDVLSSRTNITNLHLVTNLHLQASPPYVMPPLHLPAIVSSLSSLQLVLDRESTHRSVAAIIPTLSSGTRLTPLQFATENALSAYEIGLPPRLFQSCPALRELSMHLQHREHGNPGVPSAALLREKVPSAAPLRVPSLRNLGSVRLGTSSLLRLITAKHSGHFRRLGLLQRTCRSWRPWMVFVFR